MAQLMDALVKPVAGPGLELRQVPIPEPGPGEVLIKIHKTAICGTEESKEPPKKQPIKEVLQDKADEKKAQRTAPAQTKHRQQDMEL